MQQPVVRARGRYAADDAISAAAAAKGADAANLVCNKNFAAKRALTAGVFTVVCPHGTFAYVQGGQCTNAQHRLRPTYRQPD